MANRQAVSLIVSAPINNNRLRRYATYASVSVACILIAAKLTAYLLTESVAMMSSLVDSTVDLLASLVTMYGVANALRPPDDDHRFGHGKAEALAALAQAAFILGSSVLLCYEAISRFYHPHEMKNTDFGYMAMGLSIGLTVLLLGFQHYVVRRTNSMAIGADRLHYVGDLFVNIVVLAALVLQQISGIAWLDPVFALGVALVLIASSFHVVQDALSVLMDRELSEAERTKIIELATANPEVYGVHDLRTRSDGDRIFIDFHLELNGDASLNEAFKTTQQVMQNIQTAYPDADILVHQNPVGLNEDRLDSRIASHSPPRAN